MMVRRLLLLAPALLLGACVMSNLEEPAELVDFEQQAEFDEAWSASLSGSDEDLLLALRPVSDGKRVYAADQAGQVIAVDLETGRKAWRFDSDDSFFGAGLPFSAGPAVGNGYVAVASLNGDIVVLNAEDGSVAWQDQVDAEFLSAPLIESGKLLLRSSDGSLLSFALATGNPLWDTVRDMPRLTVRGQSQPAASDGQLFVAWDNGKVSALDIDSGTANWETTIGAPTGASEVQQLADIDGDVVVFGSEVYVAGYNTNLAALAIESGEILWREDLSASHGPAVSYGSVVVTDIDSVLRAYDRLSGQSLWTQDVIRARFATAPSLWKEFVVVGDFEGYLHFFDRTTGKMLARIRHDGEPVQVRPLAVGDLLVVYSIDGELTAYRQVGDE
ncbi:MAG: outer membrane protein assembly factor BamB [Gammaproteobacteria bacterium]|nr:outer membrane protein assembly factor BamB [Gammaproteobacteria bacterium]